MMDYQEEELQVMHKLNDNMLNRSFKKKKSFQNYSFNIPADVI